jgi:hypothetical protein
MKSRVISAQRTGIDLRAALERVSGRQIGTILSCVAGKLAYFESEDEAFLLAR